ncbi:GNAT family N-acetyltransferase [Eleftheria terrae]|uniref:GNAT family N-acetyltransferase n=1 Tax=Eleftheria terrae TaxID=1597781 RepID=UPI00263B933D|nr:GNAT family N-acetyltransferase [Eleftheria terrae]WKB51727.1 GNAT family N-acetyltransferase [Eleftheria terrae]
MSSVALDPPATAGRIIEVLHPGPVPVAEPAPASPEGGLLIHPACTADAAAIAAIYNDTLPPPALRGTLRALGLAEVQGWMLLHRGSGRPLWVARSGPHTVGWLSFLGYFDRPGCEATAELSVYVAPAWQGRGIGRQLVDRAVQRAPACGYRRLLAQIWSDNHASLGLFARAGFVLWGRLPGAVRIGERRCDMVLLGHELAERP